MYPTLFKVFGVSIKSYGLMLVAAFAFATWIVGRRAGKYGLTKDQVPDLALVVMLAGVVGARLGFVLLGWKDYRDDPITVLYVWQGGLSYFGGLIGGFLAAMVYVRRQKLKFWAVADLVAPAIAIGYAITRVGCFLNGCCHGGPCDLPWAYMFRDSPIPMHPTQIYSALINAGIFAALLLWEKRRAFNGQLFFGFLFLHGLYRFFIEFNRAGSTSTYLVDDLSGPGQAAPAFIPHWITAAQVAALVVVVIAVVGCLIGMRAGRSARAAAAAEPAS